MRGPAFDDVTYAKEYISQIIRHFKTLKVGSVRISPYWTFPEAEPVELLLKELGFVSYTRDSVTRSSTGLVDLTRAQDDILASLSQNTRRKIRLAERFEVAVRPARTKEEAIAFFRSLDKMNRNRGIYRIRLKEFNAAYDHILKDQNLGVLMGAFRGLMFLGGVLVIRGPSTAHCPSIVVNREALKNFKNLTITPAVFWSVFKWSKEKGCRWFDMEGYEENADLSDPRYNIFVSKKNFLPKPTQIIAQHVHVCYPAIYALHQANNFFIRAIKFSKSLQYQLQTRLSGTEQSAKRR